MSALERLGQEVEEFGSRDGFSQEELDRLTAWLEEKRRGTITAKRKQYSGTEDVLANFRRRAVLTGQTVEGVIFSDLSKHVDALGEAVRHGILDAEWEHSDGVEGYAQKIGDGMNYFELLLARAKEIR